MSPGANGDRPKGIDVSLWGIEDTDLLGIVDDLADEDGWTSTLDVRLQLGEKPGEKGGPPSGVGSRLSWMSNARADGLSYGWLERHPDNHGLWRLTAMGHAVLDNPNLSKAVERAMANLNPAQRVRVTRELGDAAATGAREVFNAQRRQWQRSMGLGRRR
jgi:hypothetical protein